ncbi:DUF4382 domain-containing protein [Membranicola marinus]|uniref:DUF4382 domain-containing protein n=1 Tax=Membranihabitans marinus TaxID=1227546 RepID=A0A953HWD3_9BACT|nr:DUF4382 domain-containing protein [Membranihabitans marinus]MBY5957766.1 DUF4382 domain-containing protein [Membranihabitans marinus]
MNLKHVSFFTMMILGLFLSSCEKEENDLTPDNNEKQGKIELEITDAPVDDPAVKSVFVTFADVQIDGQSLPGFTPVSIDLSSYTNGATYLLGGDSAKVGTYNDVTFILDPEECYVQDTEDNKHLLNPEDTHLTLDYEFELEQDSTVKLLVDFDLRKSIQRNTSDSTDRYDFVPTADLVNSLRIMDKSVTGELKGSVADGSTGSDVIVAYLYAKGTYDASTEMEEDGDTGLQFKNAISSALVQADGSYYFPYLESGEYELHLASYDTDGTSQQVQFRGMLEVNSVLADLLDIQIQSSASTEIDLSIIGLLPL